MEQNRLSLRDFGDEGRVGATLSRPKGARSPLAAQTLERRFTETGRHKGVPYIRPNSAQPYIRVVPCTSAARPRGGNFHGTYAAGRPRSLERAAPFSACSMEAPQSRPGASLPLCAGSASGPATPTSHGTNAAGRCAPSGVCSMRAPQSRDGASHSLCAASASGPATPTFHGTITAGRDAPSGVCSMRGAPEGQFMRIRHLGGQDDGDAQFERTQKSSSVVGSGFSARGGRRSRRVA